MPKCRFWCFFWKILTKKLRFFGARSPSNLKYIGSKNFEIDWLKTDVIENTKGGTL